MPNACPLPSTLCPLPHVTGLGWSCSVLPSFCPRHLVWFCGMVSACVAGLLCYLLQIVAPLAICPVPNACPLPCTLCPLPATGIGWSCSVLPSFCPSHLLCFCFMVSACAASLLCDLLPFVAFWQPALCPMHTLCPPLCALCVVMWGVTSAAPQLEPFPLLMS